MNHPRERRAARTSGGFRLVRASLYFETRVWPQWLLQIFSGPKSLARAVIENMGAHDGIFRTLYIECIEVH
jgi:hypothetical protein